MYRGEVLFSHDDEAARQEIKAHGGEVGFDFGAGVLVARLPASVDTTHFRRSSSQPPDLLDEQAKRLLEAWRLSHPLGAEQTAASQVRLEHACASKTELPIPAEEGLAVVRGLRGRIAVVLVIVSGPAAQAISESEAARVRNEAIMALDFLKSLNPVAEI